MKIIRTIVIIIIVLFLSLMMFACQQEEEQATKVCSLETEKGELEVVIVYDAADGLIETIETTYAVTLDEEIASQISTNQIQSAYDEIFSSFDTDHANVNIDYDEEGQTIEASIILDVASFNEEDEAVYPIAADMTIDEVVETLKSYAFTCN